MSRRDPPATLDVSRRDDGWYLTAAGDWTAERLEAVVGPLRSLGRRLCDRPVVWDFSAVHRIDSAGLLLWLHHRRRLESLGCRQRVVGQSAELRRLLELLRDYPVEAPPPPPKGRFFDPLTALGRFVVGGWRDFIAFLAFLGEDFVTLLRTLRHPSELRVDAIAHHIQEAGIRALPIITLTSFLIGVVIAYQGAVQLQKFGANLFVVDMIGISVTRELAPLITAIVVAGRTGSAYTAELGVMKITEEIDAMRVMGFEIHRFLVLPRILALMIALPLMIFFADLIGILGGMVVAHLHLNLSFSEFIHRTQNVVAVKHYWIGLLKGPFFAWLIATVGCFRGLQVSRDTESIGRYTTISVVNAIFLVIACDALFSVVLTELGL